MQSLPWNLVLLCTEGKDGQTDGRKLLSKICLFSLKIDILFRRLASIKSRTADSSAVAEQIPTTSKANTNNADVELVCPL